MNMQTLFQSLPPQWLELKQRVDDHLRATIENMQGPKDLQEACSYAVLEGGKRFRPTLTLLIAQAAGYQNLPLDAAISVELFHTASLVADDLPCMDNDETRRGHWTVHRKFGTATALMITFALIAEGFASLTRACRALNEDAESCGERTLLAFESASQCTGICGITGGQFCDLNASNCNRETLKEILQKKTGSLFDLALAFGWIFGKGNVQRLKGVQKLGSELGTAFQLCDDFDDFEETGDLSQTLNAVEILGKGRALDLLQELLQHCKSTALQLSLHKGIFEHLLLGFEEYFLSRQGEFNAAQPLSPQPR